MDLQAFYSKKKVLITGGLGFIGSSIAWRLVAYGADVRLVDSLIPAYGGNVYNIHGIENRVHVNFSDVRDIYSMSYLVQEQDVLFNMAGTLSHIDSMIDPFTDLEINCLSQLKILEACRNNNRGVKVIFAGTRSQYGRAKRLPVDENHPMEPTDVNGINNVAGESYHLLYSKYHGIRATSVRLTNTYGPRHQMRHSRQGFLNWFIRLALDDEEIPIYGEGSQLRDFNYIDDVVEALLLVGASDATVGEVYNLGSGEPVSVRQAAEKVIAAAGKGRIRTIPFPDDKQRIEVGDYYADFSKIRRAVRWRPTVTLAAGLSRTVEYYSKCRQHYWEKR
jgi:nucleoside-diphosphate-sugar epimerase